MKTLFTASFLNFYFILELLADEVYANAQNGVQSHPRSENSFVCVRLMRLAAISFPRES